VWLQRTWRSHPGSSSSQVDESRTLVPGLNNPTSVAIGPDGAMYVTNKTVPTPERGRVGIRVGEVLKLVPPDQRS
jgi:hypothetical protein